MILVQIFSLLWVSCLAVAFIFNIVADRYPQEMQAYECIFQISIFGCILFFFLMIASGEARRRNVHEK